MINPSVYPQVNNLSAETRNFKTRQRGIWMLCQIPHGGVRLEFQGIETSGSESGTGPKYTELLDAVAQSTPAAGCLPEAALFASA